MTGMNKDIVGTDVKGGSAIDDILMKIGNAGTQAANAFGEAGNLTEQDLIRALGNLLGQAGNLTDADRQRRSGLVPDLQALPQGLSNLLGQ